MSARSSVVPLFLGHVQKTRAYIQEEFRRRAYIQEEQGFRKGYGVLARIENCWLVKEGRGVLGSLFLFL